MPIDVCGMASALGFREVEDRRQLRGWEAIESLPW